MFTIAEGIREEGFLTCLTLSKSDKSVRKPPWIGR